MSWRDNLWIAVQGIGANKLRSALTVLGVLIGVASVVVLVAVGTGSSKAVADQINRLGTNTLTVFSTGRFGRGRATTGTQSQSASLTIADVRALQSQNDAPDVASVSPVASTTVTATYSGATYSTTATGSTPSYLTAEDYQVEAGSTITSQDVSDHARVVLLGQTVVSNLFGTSTNPIGQTIQLGSANFKVVGVLIFLPVSVAFADLVRHTTDDPARQIANAHSLFNLVVALLFLPFTRIAADVFTRIIPST